MTGVESVTRFLGWWFVHMDMALLLLFVLSGLFYGFGCRRWARLTFIKFSVLFLFLSVVPVGLWMIENLENRFPPVKNIPDDVTGIILLGGNFDLASSSARGEPAYNLAAGRLLSFIKLSKEHPHLKLAFTGGGYKIPFYGEDLPITEAELTRRELEALGFDTHEMIFEDQSRNTIENATFLKERLKPKADEKWLLVTSAFHMPRTVGLFEKEGWNVIPYPVDYHTPGQYEMWFPIGLQEGLTALHHGMREWLGMIQNYLYDRSNTLYPGPSS